MGIERERYDQMMQRRTGWDRIKAWFVFPPLPREEPPANLPSGGTSGQRTPESLPVEVPRFQSPAFPGKLIYIPPGEPTQQQIDDVAKALHVALYGDAGVSPTWIPHEPEGYDLADDLFIDGQIRLRVLAVAAIKAVRSNGL